MHWWLILLTFKSLKEFVSIYSILLFLKTWNGFRFQIFCDLDMILGVSNELRAISDTWCILYWDLLEVSWIKILKSWSTWHADLCSVVWLSLVDQMMLSTSTSRFLLQLGEEHITVLNVISPMATSIAGIPPTVVLFSFTRYALGTSGCLAEY